LFLVFPADAEYYGSVEMGASHLHSENRYIINPATMTTFDPGWQTKRRDYPVLFFNFNYFPNEYNKFYIGVPFETDPRTMIKYKRMFGNQSASISAFYYIRKPVWDGDNVIEVDHTESDRERYGGILKYSIDMFSLSYEGEIIDMDGDAIGDMFPDLKRSGDKHQFHFGFETDVLRRFKLSGNVGYVLSEINGKSNAYRAVETGIKIQRTLTSEYEER